MTKGTLLALGIAFLGTSLYYVALLLFRHAAQQMPPLLNARPLRTARHMLTDKVWLVGGLLLLLGVIYEIAAFTRLPFGTAQSVFSAGLVLLLIYAGVFLGERLRPREWTSVVIFALATVMLGLAGSGSDSTDLDPGPPATWKLVLVAGLPLLATILIWPNGDRGHGGRHALPLSGISYGIGAGICSGVAESGVRGMATVWADQGTFWSLVTTPYTSLTLVMAAATLAQLQVALQRCRVSIVATVITVTDRAVLILCGPVLFAEPWPDGLVPALLRTGGFALVLLGIVLFPRHETTRHKSGLPYTRRPAPEA